MKYLSVCSGIEAASVAWHDLGWTPVGFSEIDPFACAVLAERFPNVPNLGSLEDYASWSIEPGSVDVLVGGTPCQSFSVAGLRKGLADPRGNLALTYLGLVDRVRPRYVVWENVPGVLSSNGGRDFGAFLGALVELGYGFAYRVMDAQYVRVESHPRAVPQRRRRVFVVGCAGADWKRAASILLEPEGVRGDSAPRREAGKEAARGARPGAPSGGVDAVAGTLGTRGTRSHTEPDGHGAHVIESVLTLAIRGREDGATLEVRDDGTANALRTPNGGRAGIGVGAVAVEPGYIHPRQLRNSQSSNQIGIKPHAKVTDALASEGPGAVLVEPLPFDTTQVTSAINRSNPRPGDPCHPLTRGGAPPSVAFQWPVDVADPITAVEGRTYTHEGTTFRTHNVIPDVIGFASNLGSQGGDVYTGVSPTVRIGSGNGKGNPPAVAFSCKDYGGDATVELAPTLRAMPHDGSHANGGGQLAIAAPIASDTYNQTVSGDVMPTICSQGDTAAGNGAVCVAPTMSVRRLTPVECERLQGFPDGWTAIVYRGKPAADGPRYKALGNSMAVNVMRWIGERVSAVHGRT